MNYLTTRLKPGARFMVCLYLLTWVKRSSADQQSGRNITIEGKTKLSPTGTLLPKDPILYGSVLESAETLVSI